MKWLGGVNPVVIHVESLGMPEVIEGIPRGRERLATPSSGNEVAISTDAICSGVCIGME
jgi:hypothetical protein